MGLIRASKAEEGWQRLSSRLEEAMTTGLWQARCCRRGGARGQTMARWLDDDEGMRMLLMLMMSRKEEVGGRWGDLKVEMGLCWFGCR